MAKKFAVFDIDGTLIRWQLYHAVVDKLAKAGHIDAAAFAAVREARMTWKMRSGETSYNDYEHALVQTYESAITHISVPELMTAVTNVFDEYKNQTYTYTRNLVRSLKEQGYLLFAISASQVEIIELLANYYGFDDFGGTIYEKVTGHFTGERQTLRRERKPEYLKQLIEKHGATFTGSIGVGDSDSDIPMLEIVEHSIAFNPNKLLFEHAQTKGWKVVIERKNMVYELEQHSGNYVLAQTN
jgi:HAD superfamily hydrolase (TIGR01490 family)